MKLADIELAASIRPDVTPDRVTRLYKEANIALPAAVTKRLEDVDLFHERLRDNRLKRHECTRENKP